MDLKKGIEGDYVETNDNLFFDVKGLLHPKDQKICFIRFYPNPSGDRTKAGIKYSKIYDLNERYKFLRTNFPQYLFYSNELDLELQGVKIEDIKKIYTPREYFKSLFQRTNLTKLEEHSKELCELFIVDGGVPEDSIGISGSPMVGLHKDYSDIDIIIYGTENSLQFQENLNDILSDCGFCRKYNSQEFITHYEWRAGGSDVNFNDFVKSEQRKLHQGMYKGYDFFIRYIKSPKDWNGVFSDFKYSNLGRIKLKAKITDATDSIFTPCSYEVEILKVLECNIPNDLIKQRLREINSFRGRFCEHAKNGEDIIVEGKLEKVSFKNKEEYYRILLTDQVKDKILVIN
ncbi:MAG TPA: hypothetical protein VGB37_15340 [Candidatus Lokiarchaeia archaeon]